MMCNKAAYAYCIGYSNFLASSIFLLLLPRGGILENGGILERNRCPSHKILEERRGTWRNMERGGDSQRRREEINPGIAPIC
jgi:hypothetical protein